MASSNDADLLNFDVKILARIILPASHTAIERKKAVKEIADKLKISADTVQKIYVTAYPVLYIGSSNPFTKEVVGYSVAKTPYKNFGLLIS